jgi:hypothetical protein
MIEVGRVEPGIAVQGAIGALEAAEEVIEARMRTTPDPAPALVLALRQSDLHGAQSRRCGRWTMRAEVSMRADLAFTGRAT